MNKKIIFFLLIIVLSIFYFGNTVFNENSNTTEPITLTESSVKEKNSEEKVNKSNNLENIELKNSGFDKIFSEKFNRTIMGIYNYNDDKSLVNFIYDIRSRTKSIDDEDIQSEIENYINNIRAYPFQAVDLAISCKAINNYNYRKFNEKIDKPQFKQAKTQNYNFHQILKPYCKGLKGELDPFWTTLQMARDGDIIMQLELLRNIYMAINRGTINPLQSPMYYKQLRDEAVNYLNILAHKGLFEAAQQLAIHYDSHIYQRAGMLERNLVLAYYYQYLTKYDTQNWLGGNLDGTLSGLYNRMTTIQQNRVDRMTENL